VAFNNEAAAVMIKSLRPAMQVRFLPTVFDFPKKLRRNNER
jgi:hypothetical protein